MLNLGNPSPEVFDNEWTYNKEFDNIVKLFFEDSLSLLNYKIIDNFGNFDFKIVFKDNTFRSIIHIFLLF